MNVRFHPPQDPEQYAQQVLALLLQAAMPQAAERLAQMSGEEASGKEMRG